MRWLQAGKSRAFMVVTEPADHMLKPLLHSLPNFADDDFLREEIEVTADRLISIGTDVEPTIVPRDR